MACIGNHKYSIKQAFRACFYIVPDYPCECVWLGKEVPPLLEGIGEQIDAGTRREYFIGAVPVSPTEQKKYYESIEGQLRLTTLFLLMCALKHLFLGGAATADDLRADLDQLCGLDSPENYGHAEYLLLAVSAVVA